MPWPNRPDGSAAASAEGKQTARTEQTPANGVAMTQSLLPTNREFIETADYTWFKKQILHRSNIDLDLYKQQQMHRRLLNMVERANRRDFRDYYALLEQDTQEYAAFLDRMTINVSELFRNPEKWREMRSVILPGMLTRKQGLKIWSAGCSYGAEPYSLAMLLDQIAPGRGHTIHATDLDQNILARAREARFTDADVKNLDAEVLERYFVRDEKAPAESRTLDSCPRYQVQARIRAQVSFRAHNLLADRFESDYDLICCRNVVIYFTDDAKNRLFEQFFRALSPGGVLFVGGTERIFNFRELGFTTPLPFFYQKVETLPQAA